MYQISVKRDGFNPLTGSARYRVTDCKLSLASWHWFKDAVTYSSKNKTLHLMVKQCCKVGTIINPRKALFGDKKLIVN